MTKSLNSLEREPLVSRRKLMLLGAVVATAGLGISFISSMLRPARTETAAKATRRRPGRLPAEELMKPGPLPELAIGNADAPVTIVEYASMTCPHCASFHNNVLPELKKKYIDTGKVRLVFREFPFDERGALAAMVARCAGGDRSLPLISILFSKQDDWAQAKTDFLPKLFAYAQQAGFTRQAFDRCRQDEKLLKSLVAVRDRGIAFGVNQTPTFFVNGKKLAGTTIDDFDKAIGPVLTP
ncbi:MAG TPA: DsbA family protein [Hyphomicrobiaceae bacterium]|nr:DsbA family protein [Hyphomicrobiaceae bacterium]